MAHDSVVVALLNELFTATDTERRAALKAVIAVVGDGCVPRSQWQARSLDRIGKNSAGAREHVEEIFRQLRPPD